MTQRKSISKRLRFEVFKRDSFTCQYCGSKAPDVILEVDHINAVANGGTNEILNLITSCFDCNRGKSDKKLSDHSILNKQRKQVEDLNLRRQQLEMMLDWKNELIEMQDEEFHSLMQYIFTTTNFSLNERGEKLIRTLLKHHGFDKSINALELSFKQYCTSFTQDEVSMAINKVGGVANLMDKPPYERKVAYIIGILKNRLDYVNVPEARRLMKNMYDSHPHMSSFEDVEEVAKRCIKYEHFYNYLVNFDYY